jgi:hypothetical protein
VELGRATLQVKAPIVVKRSLNRHLDMVVVAGMRPAAEAFRLRDDRQSWVLRGGCWRWLAGECSPRTVPVACPTGRERRAFTVTHEHSERATDPAPGTRLGSRSWNRSKLVALTTGFLARRERICALISGP